MNLDEMEKAHKERRPMFGDVVKDEVSHINWRLVIAISFGFLLWHSGAAILERLFK